MRYELPDHEMDGHQADAAEHAAWRATGKQPAVLSGSFWVLRSGAPWRDLPDDFISA